jgi:hypothetical protein
VLSIPLDRHYANSQFAVFIAVFACCDVNYQNQFGTSAGISRADGGIYPDISPHSLEHAWILNVRIKNWSLVRIVYPYLRDPLGPPWI